MRARIRESEMVKRGEAARILGVTKTTVRRYETEGKLTARLEHGAHVFARRAVKLLAARRRRAARERAVTEVLLSEREALRLAAALGVDPRALSGGAFVAAAERLRALFRALRAPERPVRGSEA